VHERPVSRAAAENSRNGKRVSIDQPDNNFDSTTPKRARTNSGAGGQTTMSQKVGIGRLKLMVLAIVLQI
jgi:hypothetical protein